MRKVVLGRNMTLDGFVAGPRGEMDWIFPHFDPEFLRYTAETLSTIDTFLMGRVNYESMAAHWSNANDPIARVMNGAKKVVFTETLTRADWANTELTREPLAVVIDKLKRQSGRAIGISGGARFASSAIETGLVDEFSFSVHPVALGRGLGIFSGRLELTPLSSRPFPGGIVVNAYRPSSPR